MLSSTPASNLRLPGRYINIVTTAALPWMTGTSINPLLRAAHLSASGYNVSLVLPWIPPNEQDAIFPEGACASNDVLVMLDAIPTLIKLWQGCDSTDPGSKSSMCAGGARIKATSMQANLSFAGIGRHTELFSVASFSMSVTSCSRCQSTNVMW